MEIGIIASYAKKTRRLDATYLGFSIDPKSKRTWTEEQFSEKEKRIVEREIKVFSIDEVMSPEECLNDDYHSRGRRIPFVIQV